MKGEDMTAEEHAIGLRDAVAIAESDDPKREAWKVVGARALALRDDFDWSYGAIGRAAGKSEAWAREVVVWAKNPQGLSGPWSADSQRREDTATRRVVLERPDVVVDAIRDAPPEIQTRIVESLPPARPVIPGTVGEMEAELGPMPAPPASRIAAVLRIASDVEDLRARFDHFGVDDADAMTLRQARRACESAVDALLTINAAIAEALNEAAPIGGD